MEELDLTQNETTITSKSIIVFLNTGDVVVCKNFQDYLIFLDERSEYER